MTYPDAEVVTNGYLPNGQLSSVVGTSTYLGAATYTPWGAPDVLTLGTTASPVLKVDYDYYAWNGGSGEGQARLSRIMAGVPSDLDSLQDLRYFYDLAGNVETIQDYKTGNPQTQSFGYDDLNRLTNAGASGGTGGTYTEAYEHSDAQGGKLGNLTKKGASNYTYGTQSTSCPDGALNKPHAVVLVGGMNYCYDRDGNMVKRYNGVDTLAYDAENRLTGVTTSSTTATFVYGPGGERVKGTVGSTTTYYVGTHYEKQGSTVRKYYYAAATRVAMYDSSLNPTLYYLLADHLGSQALTVEGSGSQKGTSLGEVRYKAFGEDRYTSGTTPTTYRYTRQRSESGIGLYYYGARWYDPYIGRFIQADTIVPSPANPQLLNRFSYVQNNHCAISILRGTAYREWTVLRIRMKGSLQTRRLSNRLKRPWKRYWPSWDLFFLLPIFKISHLSNSISCSSGYG